MLFHSYSNMEIDPQPRYNGNKIYSCQREKGWVVLMNEIIRILMERDGVSREEAREMYLECKSELMDAISGTSCLDPEEVLASELGLEPDYFIYFL